MGSNLSGTGQDRTSSRNMGSRNTRQVKEHGVKTGQVQGTWGQTALCASTSAGSRTNSRAQHLKQAQLVLSP
eukprot:222480-Chlamydomonas_euryale.AAC.2